MNKAYRQPNQLFLTIDPGKCMFATCGSVHVGQCKDVLGMETLIEVASSRDDSYKRTNLGERMSACPLLINDQQAE